MTDTATERKSHTTWAVDALRAVASAGSDLAAAKRTKSAALVTRAERELRNAVDGARELGVEWGRIGSALGIARGNAYQRYRKRPVLTSRG